MKIKVYGSKEAMVKEAADLAALTIIEALKKEGEATIILATGISQVELLESLVARDIDWPRVTVFHLDEYIGLPISHPGSFRKYLKERFEERVGELQKFHYIDGENPDPLAECRRLNGLIADHNIALACVGIGENGHLAFNDPPADFETETPYLVVELDEACRRQQLGEGWFPTLEAVPQKAISMSIQQILKSKTIICSVPDQRKAEAVRNVVNGAISPEVPASILRNHSNCHFLLDEPAASLLNRV